MVIIQIFNAIKHIAKAIKMTKITQKTPQKEIDKADRLMKEYYEEKDKENGN